MKYAMWILWPSFLVSGVAEGIFFTLVDPMDLPILGMHAEFSRTAIYTVGYFAFWMMTAVSSALTLFLQRGAGGEDAG